jgi:hypothetical protein
MSRWARHYAPIPALAKPGAGRAQNEGGVYVLFGGVGRIGLALAEALAGPSSRLVLTNRSGNTEERHRSGLERLRQKGAELMVVPAEITRRASIRDVLDTALRRFGPVRGVAHLAGLVDARFFHLIPELGEEEAAEHFAPKALGLLALEEELATFDLEFCLLLSSISTVLGGLGFSAYAAANAFLDARVAWLNRRAGEAGRRASWMSVDWDGAFDDEEAVLVFERILESGSIGHVDRLVVSPERLEPRLAQWSAHAAAPLPKRTGTHPRPLVRTPFRAPNGPTEERICALMGDLLGIEEVGAQDSFIDLGGNSLIARQLLTRLRAHYQVEVSLRDIFERPTAEHLAETIEHMILAKLESLPDSELK